MEIGKKCGPIVNNRGNEEYGTLGLVRSTSFGRKRVALSNCLEFGDDDDGDCVHSTSCKRLFSRFEFIRILCGVEHDDLKSLFFVSKAMREATLVAKKSHFAYSTPRKTVIFQSVDDFGDFNEIEAPNAPKQSRIRRSRLSAKKLTDISVNLFNSDNNEVERPRRNLFLETETGI
ncbi:hypothetical protein DH2020_032858 [Rehmannia glutinosa]|uniref:F-box protein n=1 Tax=Rehmannia glutinosa TaxID=99300 RepID=A0ABR0VH25_REHGL